MTLGVMISTSSGIVICTDSLVTTSMTHAVLKDPAIRIDVPSELWDLVNNGESGFATPRSNLEEKDSILSTSPNVKKMFQIGDHPIVFTMAGENNWKYTLFSEIGWPEHFPVPLESYVDTVVQNVIDNLNGEPDFEDIVNCLAFVLNFGHLIGNKEYSENGKTTVYSIMGGGYGKGDAYPRSFSYRMPGGRERQSVLAACNRTFCSALADTFIQSSYSTSWFYQYCEEDLIPAVDAAHAQAWVWGVHYGWSSESIIEKLIPHVNQNISDGLLILSELTSQSPHEFLELKNLSTASILSNFWNSFNESKARSEIDDIISKIDNVSPRMLKIIQSGDPKENVKTFRNKIGEYVMGLYPKTYENQTEKIKKSISERAFNSLWCILEYVLPSCILSLSQLRGNISSEKVEFAHSMWTGLEYIGNAEVIEKITNGLDSKTFYNISDDIKSYQMHAAERLATIIRHKIMNEEPPEYAKYGKQAETNDLDPNSPEQELDDEPNTSDNQTKLPLISADDRDVETPENVDLSGMWMGFFTTGESTAGEVGKLQFELELSYDSNDMLVGKTPSTGATQLEIREGTFDIKNNNLIRFDMIIDGNRLSKVSVECEVKAWGIEGSFTQDGHRESLIMHRNDSNNAIDSEKLTSDALNQLVIELERIYPNYQTWEVNYNTLPLESAIKMAQYLMNSTVMKQRFNRELPSVGGPIRTMVITRKDGVMALDDYQI